MPTAILDYHGFLREVTLATYTPEHTEAMPVKLLDQPEDLPRPTEPYSINAVKFRYVSDGRYRCAGCFYCEPGRERRQVAHVVAELVGSETLLADAARRTREMLLRGRIVSIGPLYAEVIFGRTSTDRAYPWLLPIDRKAMKRAAARAGRKGKK